MLNFFDTWVHVTCTNSLLYAGHCRRASEGFRRQKGFAAIRLTSSNFSRTPRLPKTGSMYNDPVVDPEFFYCTKYRPDM